MAKARDLLASSESSIDSVSPVQVCEQNDLLKGDLDTLCVCQFKPPRSGGMGCLLVVKVL